jgi:hypothetical protein
MTQVSVHVENRPGALAELTEMLHDNDVNILAIAVPDAGEFGTVRILPANPDEARMALNDAGMPNTAVDVLVVELPHRPGALAKMARILADESIVIRYAYASEPVDAERGLCVMQVDDIHRAEEALKKKLQ